MYRLLMIGFILWFLSPGGQIAEAEEKALDMDVSIEVPFHGIYKGGKMVRFSVHVKNHDEPFSGEMMVKQLDFVQPQTLSSPKQFQMEANEEKIVTIDVNSDQLMNGGRQVGVSILQDGKEVDWVPVHGLAPHHEWLIGVIAKDSNAFHFLSMAQPENGRNLSVKQLEPDAIPDESILMNHLDLLAIGDLSDDLEEDQINAIKEWIGSGGVLLVSGGKSYETVSKSFGDLLPYRSSETTLRDISSDLERLTDLKAPVEPVSVLKEAKNLFHTEKFGQGLILTVAYDVTEEPLVSWQGNKTLWHQALNQWLLDAMVRKDMRPLIDHGLLDVSYMTPGVTPPKFPLIAIIWGVYLLVVTPGLYLFLKRRDKREWAWILIPSLSILLTAGIYMLGKYWVAKEDSVHTVSSIQILDEQQAEVSSAASFLMVEGGTYTVDKADGTTIIPLQIGNPQIEEKALSLELGAVQFKKIPYLSMKEVYSHSIRKDIGHIENQLYIEDERIRGKVGNLTSFDLKNVLLTVGMQEIPLGDLPMGKEMQIDKELQRVYVPESSLLDWQREGRFLSRWERMERLQRTSYDLNGSSIPVMISGLSEEGIEIFNVRDREEEKYFSTMIRQSVALSPLPNGKQIFPYGTLPLRLGETKGNWEGMLGGYYLSNGFMNFALKVQPNGVGVNRIVVPLNEAPYKPFTKNIYNVKKEQWETLQSDQPFVLSGAEKDAYITPQGEIVLRFIQDSEERVFLPQPYFLVEGEVNKHD
ncbi:hypothetical protein [Ammoniphilus sp. 3BR4]|uniref:hypothetical protein n=1 Tax=Ammoniphilus sp. 3BR4 TaxID=3158265 RepID=UPI00346790C7